MHYKTNSMKALFSYLYVILALFITSCSDDPTSEIEYNYTQSKEFVFSEDYTIDKWQELDSLFKSSLGQFRFNESKYDIEYISKTDALAMNYESISQEFYKKYFSMKINKLQYLITSVDFTDAASFENFSSLLSSTQEEFDALNTKMSPEIRNTISENIGLVYGNLLEKKSKIFSEDLNNKIEDITNQIKFTLKGLFN